MTRKRLVLLATLLVWQGIATAQGKAAPAKAAEAPPVLLEGARLPAGTTVESLDHATLARLGGQFSAQRYRVTAAPESFQISCNYTSGTSAIKRAVWELSVFDDASGAQLARTLTKLMEIRDRRNAEWLTHCQSLPQGWGETPDSRPPLRLYRTIGRPDMIVAWADGKFWEWTFRGFAEDGGAFGNGDLPGEVLYGQSEDGVKANSREGLTATEAGFLSFYMTSP